ncbi:MAG TPA: hypothetical protein VGR07_10280 [Thermoanaerobaculia bacterium]|jgi:hypothetical protein|nr:hypothetical protein [Thermoanaerobaculia bacterium]
MTGPCPDWRDLTALRNDAPFAHAVAAGEPAGWSAALEHLDGCPACRRAAVAADPTLLFRRLPALATEMSADAEAAEVDSMRQAVAAMRTARRLEPASERAAWAAWKRWAAAASLVAAALSLGAGHSLRRDTPATSVAAIPSIAGVAVPLPVTVAPMQAVPRFVSEQAPMVEELNRPAARVYQMDGGKNLSVVMIVDERLDV